MKKIGVVPARFESSRLPGKPLIEIAGHPLIWWVYTRSMNATCLDDLVVATDDKRVVDYCKSEGMHVIMTSSDHNNGTERLVEVAEQIFADEYVQIQGDEPTIDPKNIEMVLDVLNEDESVLCSMLKTAFRNPVDVVDTTTAKIVTDINNNALIITRQPVPFPKGTSDFVFWEPLGTVGWKREMLLKFNTFEIGPMERAEEIEFIRVLENGYKIKVGVTDDYRCIEINTKKDIEVFERYIGA